MKILDSLNFKLSFLHEYYKNFQIFLYKVMHQGQQNKTIFFFFPVWLPFNIVYKIQIDK